MNRWRLQQRRPCRPEAWAVRFLPIVSTWCRRRGKHKFRCPDRRSVRRRYASRPATSRQRGRGDSASPSQAQSILYFRRQTKLVPSVGRRPWCGRHHAPAAVPSTDLGHRQRQCRDSWDERQYGRYGRFRLSRRGSKSYPHPSTCRLRFPQRRLRGSPMLLPFPQRQYWDRTPPPPTRLSLPRVLCRRSVPIGSLRQSISTLLPKLHRHSRYWHLPERRRWRQPDCRPSVRQSEIETPLLSLSSCRWRRRRNRNNQGSSWLARTRRAGANELLGASFTSQEKPKLYA